MMLKKIACLSACLITANTLAYGEQAAVDNKKDDDSGFYIGVKAGKTKIDAPYYDDDTGKGFVVGYDFGGFGIEFEHTETEGDVSVPFYGKGDYEVETNALYAVYRSRGAAYFKAKIGVLNEDVTIKILV